MATMYNCECKDGRTITGSSRWELTDLKKMNPLELAKVLSEMSEFARYYESNFFQPCRRLEKEIKILDEKFQQAKKQTGILGITTCVFTVLWILFTILPIMRFSGLTLILAILTFCSILIFIPVIFRFFSAQEDNRKRLPRIQKKLEQLYQKQEKEIFGTYLDYLIGGYIVSPEYSLSADALELMGQALQARRATNMSEATVLCKKKYRHSPVPRIIAALRSVGDPSEPKKIQQEQPAAKKVNIQKMQSQSPDFASVLQLTEFLYSAVKSLAASQKAAPAASGDDSIAATMTLEEESLIHEFRSLTPEEKKRIRRVVHSFYTKQY